MVPSWLPWLPLFVLAFARCAGMVCLAPPLNWRHFPFALRLAVAAVLAVPLLLCLPAQPSSLSAGVYLALLVREVAVGAALGLGLWLLVTAAASAGQMIDAGSGEGATERPLAVFLTLLVIVFFVQLNGLPWLVSALRESYNLLPLSSALGPVSQWHEVVYLPARMFVTTLTLAAPIVLAVILASALVTSLQRCLPALQTGQLGPAARHLTALLALVVVAPLLGMFVLGEMTYAAQAASRVLLEVAGR